MNIKVTGCNNCPFAVAWQCELYYHINKNPDKNIIISTKKEKLLKKIPKKCPVKQGKSFEIHIN